MSALEPRPGNSGCMKPDPKILIVTLRVLFYLATGQIKRLEQGYKIK